MFGKKRNGIMCNLTRNELRYYIFQKITEKMLFIQFIQQIWCKRLRISRNFPFTFSMENLSENEEIIFVKPKYHLEKFIANRSNRSQMFYEIGAPKNFAKSNGKHLCWCVFLMKLQTWFFFDFRGNRS